jgi:hypothetical protein
LTPDEFKTVIEACAKVCDSCGGLLASDAGYLAEMNHVQLAKYLGSAIRALRPEECNVIPNLDACDVRQDDDGITMGNVRDLRESLAIVEAERDALAAENMKLREERGDLARSLNQQERFKWAANERADALAEAEKDAKRYRWLRVKFSQGYETYIAESIETEKQLDDYIDNAMSKEREG